jgi:hypothetical protein
MKFQMDRDAVLSAAELSEAVGADPETINNWVRRKIIRRALIGGRELRHRLFSIEEVYKTALKNELVKLPMSPSQASGAIEELWKEWTKLKQTSARRNLCGVISLSNGKWTASFFSQSTLGRKLETFAPAKSDDIELPGVFAVVQFSAILARAEQELAKLLSKKTGRTG